MTSPDHPDDRIESTATALRTGGDALRVTDSWQTWVPLVVVAVVAVVLRLAASRGDLVLDEVWSWLIASGVDSARQIFVMPVDNNHILNTLVLYACGPRAPLWAYRLPAVLAGAAALWFAFQLARRQGTSAAFCVIVILSFSHVLILLGTEARGYGYLACCTLAAWWGLEKYLERPQLRYVFVFGLASSLGFLSHLTFLFGYLAFGIYAAMKLRSLRGKWQEFVVLNALPVLTCVVLLFTYALGMSIGGGNETPLFETLLATLSLMAGGPENGKAASVAAGTMAVLIVAALGVEFRSDRARGVLFLTAMIVAPAVVLAAAGYTYIHPRYFLVPMIFGYVAVGFLLARWFRAGRIGRYAVPIVLMGFVASNLMPVVGLIREGRGRYSYAMRWMAEHTVNPAVTVAGDHDWRNGLLVSFYADRNSLAKSVWAREFSYFPNEQYPRKGTEWYLRHRLSGESAPADAFTDTFGNEFELVHVFPAGSISGWTWWLYQRKTGQSGR